MLAKEISGKLDFLYSYSNNREDVEARPDVKHEP